ncbi:MAG: hypothetical protein D6732_05070 [Methanobacteriota archaeon]|nr:MAG: hypothetical protein D6732_05070 [Euryarchaeota archaeon]
MSIPLPNVSKDKDENFKSECELYDGNKESAGLCYGWVTKTGKCMRRDDDIAKRCDGFGNIAKD